MREVRKVCKMAVGEYLHWMFNCRMILLPCVFILLYNNVTVELLKCADKMSMPINVLEPVIGVCNSPKMLGLIPIIFLILISDFPRIDNNIIYKIFRAGRKKWFISQFLFLFFADVTFMAVLFIGMVLPVCNRGFLYNGWSDVITELTENLPEMSGTFVAGLIPANLYYQMLPYKALVYSFVFLGLYFYLMGLIMMTAKLLGHRIVGFVIAGTILTLGSALAQFELKIEWILPAAHSIVKNHFSTYYRAMKCPLQTSVIYFTIMICILSVMSYYFVRKFDYVKMNEL